MALALLGTHVALALVLTILPHLAFAQPIAPARTFTCGAGFTKTTIGVSDNGAVADFESPAGRQQIAAYDSGYKACYSTGGAWQSAQEFSLLDSGWGPPSYSQPNGPSTFPLLITRTTLDGALTMTRYFSGNSFVGPGSVSWLDLNGNGQLCDTLSECGNCGNRTLHVNTWVKNNTGSTMSVRFVEVAHMVNYHLHKTDDSVHAFTDTDDALVNPAHGMMLQTLVTPASTAVQWWYFPCEGCPPYFDLLSSSDCTLSGVPTPTYMPGGGMALLRQDVTLSPMSTNKLAIRVHYRRY